MNLQDVMGILALVVSVLVVAGALVAFVTAATEMVKLAAKRLWPPDGIPSEFVPALAWTIGILLALAFVGFRPDTDYRVAIIGGMVGGWASCKLFDLGQAGARMVPRG